MGTFPSSFEKYSRVLLLMGPPGSGKSTAAAYACSIRPHCIHISTGELVRSYGSARERANIAAGRFTPDIVIQRMLLAAIKVKFDSLPRANARQALILLDGFPRTPAQVDWLCCQTRVLGRVMLRLPREIAVSRLLTRVGDRPEDTPERIARRYDDYDRLTLAAGQRLLDRALTTGLPGWFELDAAQSQEQVGQRLVEIVDQVSMAHIKKVSLK